MFIDNLTDYNLIAHEGGSRVITPPDPLAGAAISHDVAEDTESDESTADLAASSSAVPGTVAAVSKSLLPANGVASSLVGEIQPQVAFNIQIQLPENAKPETYEAIFKNISVHLLGRPEE